MRSALAWILWIALAGLGASGMSDALRPILPSHVHFVGLIVYAAVIATLPAYRFLRHRNLHWPTLYIAVAVVSVFAGSLLLARPDSISEGSAFFAMGVSIFVAVLLRRPRQT